MIVVQMSQEYGRDLVFGNTAREQVLVEERDRVDQQVVAVVTKRETTAGFLGRKSGRAAKHFDPHLGKAAGHVVGWYRVGRDDCDIVIQVNVNVAALIRHQVAIDALAFDRKISGDRDLIFKRQQVE